MVSNPHLALLGWLSSREAGRPGDTGLGRRDQTAYFAPASPSTTCHTRHVCTHAWHVHIHRHACVHKHLCTLTHSSPSSCPLRCVFQDSVHLQGLSDRITELTFPHPHPEKPHQSLNHRSPITNTYLFSLPLCVLFKCYLQQISIKG